MKAHQLLADPANWLKGPANYCSDIGPCCVMGAVRRVYAPGMAAADQVDAFNHARDTLKTYLGVEFLTDWNDAKERTHAEVHAALVACDL